MKTNENEVKGSVVAQPVEVKANGSCLLCLNLNIRRVQSRTVIRQGLEVQSVSSGDDNCRQMKDN